METGVRSRGIGISENLVLALFRRGTEIADREREGRRVGDENESSVMEISIELETVEKTLPKGSYSKGKPMADSAGQIS